MYVIKSLYKTIYPSFRLVFITVSSSVLTKIETVVLNESHRSEFLSHSDYKYFETLRVPDRYTSMYVIKSQYKIISPSFPMVFITASTSVLTKMETLVKMLC